MKRLLILSCVALMGCPPDDPEGIPGAMNRLRFAENARTPIAAGAIATVHLLSTGNFVIASSDPGVFEIDASGNLVARAPGTANLEARENGALIDYVPVTVASVARLEILESGRSVAAAVPGYARLFGVSQRDAAGTPLQGSGAFTVTVDGVLTLSEASSGEISVSGSMPGEGRIIAASGAVQASHSLRVVSEDEIDEVAVGTIGRAGGSADGTAAIRVILNGRIAGADVAGATCDWEVEAGTMIGLDSVQPDGSLLTDFWTRADHLRPICRMGKIAKPIEIMVKPLE